MPVVIFVVYVVAGRTDNPVVDVRDILSAFVGDKVACTVMSALPSLSVARASNVNSRSEFSDIVPVCVVFPVISRPDVADIVPVAGVSGPEFCIILVMTEFILNVSPGATANGADVDIITGDCTNVFVSPEPTAVAFVATANTAS